MKKRAILIFALIIFLTVAVAYIFFGGEKKVTSSLEKCRNEVQDSGEEGIDCGGECAPCVTYERVSFSPPVNKCSGGVANGFLQPGEECDGVQFSSSNGLCSNYSSSYNYGSLFCTPYCTIDAGACSPGVCGNGICEVRTESHFNCPQDCNGNYTIVDSNNPQCSDSGSGNLTKPFCSLGGAFNTGLKAGDTIYLRGGEQHSGGYRYWDMQGAPGNFITFRNYPGETPVIEKGTQFSNPWTFVQNAGNQKIWKTNSSFGPATFDLSGKVSNYPGNIFRGLKQPLSPMIEFSNLTSVLSVPNRGSSFEAYNFNCSDGTLYVRLDADVDPNSERIYYGSDQFQGNFSNIRFLGLTLQHANEGFKMVYPASYNEFLDNVIQSVAQGFEDLGGNNMLVQGNTFREIAPEVIVVPQVGPLHGYWFCKEETGLGNYYYYDNYLDHVSYGGYSRKEFSYNYVDAPELGAGVRISPGDKIYNNFLNVSVFSRGITGSAEFFNNIVMTNRVAALDLQQPSQDLKIYNNIFIGGDVYPYSPSVVGIGEFGFGAASHMLFYNNVIVNGNASANFACMTVNAFYRDFSGNSYNTLLSGLDFNNNIYVNCSGWRVHSSPYIASYVFSNLSDWINFSSSRFYSGGNESKSAYYSNENSIFKNFQQFDFSPAAGSPTIDKGAKLGNLSFDILQNKRPFDVFNFGNDYPSSEIYDIGPYEKQVSAAVYCFDGVQDYDETGIDCGNSCSACSVASGEGASGGGGGVNRPPRVLESFGCLPVWNCSLWGPCVGRVHYRTCQDLESCNISSGKPFEIDACSQPQNTAVYSSNQESATEISHSNEVLVVLGNNIAAIILLLLAYTLIVGLLILLTLRKRSVEKSETRVETNAEQESSEQTISAAFGGHLH